MIQNLLLIFVLHYTPPSELILLAPFEGFTESGLAPVYDLFRADPEGRLLLRKSWKKLDFRGTSELSRIFCYCTEEQLGGIPERRGLFIQETAKFYRTRGEDDWRTETVGGLEKLAAPDRFPILQKRISRTRNFELMAVAFRPKICIRQGLNVLQVYLVLYHELVHLVGLDPFTNTDILRFTERSKEREYYLRELEKPGGEFDAFLAQVKAYWRLSNRYDIPEGTVLETFLSKKGRLSYRDKPEFLRVLLDEANYRAILDLNLEVQIMAQYNRALSWAEFIEKHLENMDQRLSAIGERATRIREALAQAERNTEANSIELYTDMLAEIERERLLNRREHRSLKLEQREYVRMIEAIDNRFPVDE